MIQLIHNNNLNS